MRKRLALFVGGDLTHREQLQIEAHLATCRRCRQELENFERAEAALRALAESDAVLTIPSVLPELRQRLTALDSSPPRTEQRVPRAVVALLGGVVVATIALGALLAGLFPVPWSEHPVGGVQPPAEAAPVRAETAELPAREAVAPQLDMATLVSDRTATRGDVATSGETQCRYALDLATPMDVYEPALDEY